MVEKRKGLEFLFAPDVNKDGRIVSMIQFKDWVIIACEYAVYRYPKGDGGVEKVTPMPEPTVRQDAIRRFSEAMPNDEMAEETIQFGKRSGYTGKPV